MLGTLRKHSRSVIIYVLFGVIIIVFVFTFNVASPDAGCGGGNGGARAGVLATVAGEPVDGSALAMGLALSADPVPAGALNDPKSFQAEMVYRSTRFARMRGDGRYASFVPDPRAVSGLKVRKVMDDLLETFLVSEEAKRMGLEASPEEIRERIVKEFSGSGGEFKRRSYEDWVRYGLRTSLARFEDFVRREILREKAIGLLVAGVTIPDREARTVASLRRSKRTYEYVEANPTAVAEAFSAAPAAAAQYVPGAAPSAEEIAAYLKDSDADARRYYEEHKADLAVEARHDLHLMRFSAPSRRVLSAITNLEARKGLEDQRGAARKKAEEAAATLAGKAGADLVAAFEAAAKTSDDAATSAAGGRQPPLGSKAIAAMDPALLAAVEAADPGKATGVVEGDDAFFVALVDGRTPGAERSFDSARETIATRVLAARKAADGAEKLAQAALDRAAASPTTPLADVVAAINAPFAPAAPLVAGDTGEVAGMPDSLSGLLDWDPDAVPGIGASKDLAEAVRALTAAAPVAAKTHKVGDSSYVVRLRSETAGGDPAPDEIEAARNDFLPVKRQAYYREWYRQLRTEAAAKGTLVEHESLTALVRDEARDQEDAAKRARKEPRPRPGAAEPAPAPAPEPAPATE